MCARKTAATLISHINLLGLSLTRSDCKVWNVHLDCGHLVDQHNAYKTIFVLRGFQSMRRYVIFIGWHQLLIKWKSKGVHVYLCYSQLLLDSQIEKKIVGKSSASGRFCLGNLCYFLPSSLKACHRINEFRKKI